MPNLKDLKIRIDSVKSTQKITSAMKMVAAAKLKRAQERAQASRPYSDSMKKMLSALSSSYKNQPLNGPKLLTGSGKDETYMLIILTSDKGLCGAFNASLIKKAKEHIKQLESAGKNVCVLPIGRKGEKFFKKYMPSAYMKTEFDFDSNLNFSQASTISDYIVQLFEDKKFDKCNLLFNKFKSALTQIPTIAPLIPFETEENNESSSQTNLYEFEPNEEAVLAELLPSNLSIQIYQGLLENSASEHGSRMTAMDNATRNAGDMIKKLTLTYNRTRQALITKELIEIISGTEAL